MYWVFRNIGTRFLCEKIRQLLTEGADGVEGAVDGPAGGDVGDVGAEDLLKVVDGGRDGVGADALDRFGVKCMHLQLVRPYGIAL